MSIDFQAPDALLHVVTATLKGDMWGDRVYAKFAPSSVKDSSNVWVVVRVVSDVPSDFRGDRDGRSLVMAVQAVGNSSAMCERASARIYDLLHLAGVNDRRAVTIGVHSAWTFLGVRAGRGIRLVPSKELGLRFFEIGYQFDVTMEAKNGYV